MRASAIVGHAQQNDVAPLFHEDQAMSIRLNVSLAAIKKNNSDSIYFPTSLHYKELQGTWDSIPISIRARGNFRRKHCFFPPMRIKISKNAAKGTPFTGTKSLKLVLPCESAKNSNHLLMKEYICYELYKPITPFSFETRLLEITMKDESGRQPKTYQLAGFFIEDDDAAARRLQAKPVDEPKLNPLQLGDTSSLRLDLFQYMIANTDYSTTFSHNVKTIKTEDGRYIPIPYDFDMAGFVNAPYATFDESLGIRSVHERVYKGFCRNEKVTEFVRNEYVELEPEINKVIDRYESQFEAKEFTALRKYMSEFFTTMKNDTFYREQIIRKCRTLN